MHRLQIHAQVEIMSEQQILKRTLTETLCCIRYDFCIISYVLVNLREDGEVMYIVEFYLFKLSILENNRE